MACAGPMQYSAGTSFNYNNNPATNYNNNCNNLVQCLLGPTLYKPNHQHKDSVAESLSQHRSTLPCTPEHKLMQSAAFLANLQKSEERWCGPGCLINYCTFPCKRSELENYMRESVVNWMNEVCAEVRADVEVFPLAVSLMDRFLSIEQIYKQQLQGLAASCLLLASKVKMPYPFTLKQLVGFTENSYHTSELLSWELLVLNKLKWNVATVNAMEYIEPLLARIHVDSVTYQHVKYLTQDHVYIAMRQLDLCTLPPSLQAAACLCASFAKLFPGDPFVTKLHDTMPAWINADTELLRSYSERVLSASRTQSTEPSSSTERSTMSRSASTDSGYNSSICASPN